MTNMYVGKADDESYDPSILVVRVVKDETPENPHDNRLEFTVQSAGGDPHPHIQMALEGLASLLSVNDTGRPAISFNDFMAAAKAMALSGGHDIEKLVNSRKVAAMPTKGNRRSKESD